MVKISREEALIFPSGHLNDVTVWYAIDLSRRVSNREEGKLGNLPENAHARQDELCSENATKWGRLLRPT